MKKIELTQNKVAIVDAEDYEKLNQFKWHAKGNKYNIWYAARSDHGNKKCKTIRLHREILGVPAGMYIDHINGDGLDNRKENLRVCANQENTCNRKNANRNNKLGIKGVFCHTINKKFIAKIKVNGIEIYLGSYTVLGDADSAYRFAEEKYFGKFARNANELLPVILESGNLR